jgi:hypothetical protein
VHGWLVAGHLVMAPGLASAAAQTATKPAAATQTGKTTPAATNAPAAKPGATAQTASPPSSSKPSATPAQTPRPTAQTPSQPAAPAAAPAPSPDTAPAPSPPPAPAEPAPRPSRSAKERASPQPPPAPPVVSRLAIFGGLALSALGTTNALDEDQPKLLAGAEVAAGLTLLGFGVYWELGAARAEAANRAARAAFVPVPTAGGGLGLALVRELP